MRARIYLFPKACGARQNDFTAGKIRIDLVFLDDPVRVHFGCELEVAASTIQLDRLTPAEIQIFNLRDARKFIRLDGDFRICEGSRMIGIGFWTDVGESVR